MINRSYNTKEMINMKHAIAAVLLCAALPFVVADRADADTFPRKDWRACLSDEGESSFNCVWDARHMGNGEGRSFFINRKGVHPIHHARAHDMLNR